MKAHVQRFAQRISSIALILTFLTFSVVVDAHFIVPMQVDRQGYRANLQMIQWYEGFINDGTIRDDIDVSGITTGRIVMNIFIFDGNWEPLDTVTDITLTLVQGETELGPWDLERFLEASYTTTQTVEDPGKWDALVRFSVPDEATPVNARFVEFDVFPADAELAPGRVISDPNGSGPNLPPAPDWWVWVIGGLALLGITGLIFFGLMQGRKDGKNKEDQTK